MATITFADVVHQAISFSRNDRVEGLVLDLIDSGWVQRLRDISQTANTRLVYMFSEHSRFGHSLGVAYLANSVLKKIAQRYPREVEPYRAPVLVAALLHDIGHLAPGSHTAYRTWFPQCADHHEQTAARILQEDPEISALLDKFDPSLASQVCAILGEREEVPPWTWELISGGGWNVDRGNWCIVDSILAGVSYGRYNIPALTESLVITETHHLAVEENRLDAMAHFALSRHAMYRQMYQHRVLLAADTINTAIARRARDLRRENQEISSVAETMFVDETMARVLDAESPDELSLATMFEMRESWWRYHLSRWTKSRDPILADLSSRLLTRHLFKTVRIQEQEDSNTILESAERAVRESGFDPRYYLHTIATSDVQADDHRHSMPVILDDGRTMQLTEAEPLFQALMRCSSQSKRMWIALPAEAKSLLGRDR